MQTDNEKKVKSGRNKNKVLTGNVAAVFLLLAVVAYVFLGTRANNLRFKSNNLDFQSNIDGTVSVVGIDDEVETISIPSEVRHWWKTYSVTIIAYDAFSGCSSLEWVEMNSETTFDNSVFINCTNMQNIIRR